jgi:hypothetical protein
VVELLLLITKGAKNSDMKIYHLILIMCLTGQIFGQSNEEHIIWNFINDLKGSELDSSQIVKKHFSFRDIETERIYFSTLAEQVGLIKRNLNCKDLQIVKHGDSNLPDIKALNLEVRATQVAYYVLCSGQVLPILLDTAKISSITTVKKGNHKRYFITY